MAATRQTANRLAELASQALGEDVLPQQAEVIGAATPSDRPRPVRCCGFAVTMLTASHGRPSVKVLQHVRRWVLLPLLRAEFAEEFAAEFPWQVELEVEAGLRESAAALTRFTVAHARRVLGAAGLLARASSQVATEPSGR